MTSQERLQAIRSGAARLLHTIGNDNPDPQTIEGMVVFTFWVNEIRHRLGQQAAIDFYLAHKGDPGSTVTGGPAGDPKQTTPGRQGPTWGNLLE